MEKLVAARDSGEHVATLMVCRTDC